METGIEQGMKKGMGKGVQTALPPASLVVNWNSQELHHLALGLAQAGQLSGYVRPYVNKGRAWERGLAAMPWAGGMYAATFGRRQLMDPCLIALTHEAGVVADLLAAAAAKAKGISEQTRHDWTNRLWVSVRRAVAAEACRRLPESGCVVAYEGFALPAFQALRQRASGARAVLSYPVAHHRHRKAVRAAEIERQPEFASTWPAAADWVAGYEGQLDEEIELADLVLLGSGYARDTFIAQGVPAAKLKVVPYGVNLALFRPDAGGPKLRGSGFQALFAGQLSQRKGLSYLLQAWQLFQAQRPVNATLCLVGALVGDADPLARHRSAFTHVPHQTRPQLAERFRQADVFVFPTLVEGLPLVVLEAMACGLPIIATANGPAEVVRDGVDGFIVPERDPQALAEKLQLLYANPDMRLSMGRNAAARARAYGWETYVAGALDAMALGSEIATAR